MLASASDPFRRQVENAALRALVWQDMAEHSPTYGSFDRRFWAWKLVDCPEATFQRLAHPLALLYRDPASPLRGSPAVARSIAAALHCSVALQHPNGAFDQAFPREHSVAGTAFLLHSLVEAYSAVVGDLDADTRGRVEGMLLRAARFVCQHDERHGDISNHTAGTVLALTLAARLFDSAPFRDRAALLLERLLNAQSPEGWFPEYGAADAGYQTLCLYYLAEIRRLLPTPRLERAIAQAVGFLQWFVNPDGTFAGLAGSRRTGICYLGGLALTATADPVARAIYGAMRRAHASNATISLDTIDAGNLAPLLTNGVVALHAERDVPSGATASLPNERASDVADFPAAGIHVRITPAYVAVIGTRNGGTIAIFDRKSGAARLDDGGYVGRIAGGSLLTSQASDGSASVVAADDAISVSARLRHMRPSPMSPLAFVAVRLLGMTLFRSIRIGNAFKQLVVRRLMQPGKDTPVSVRRHFRFAPAQIVIEDTVTANGVRLEMLTAGRPFSAIHMASAGYQQPARLMIASSPIAVDVDALARDGEASVTRLVDFSA